ncbi:hypothetical protein ASPZODRAFT_100149 [Penicilliopsis zonata CBS 506.65]|uniref:Uncharacterized protein n=1 Tax=Penicilliopsis zonata CBS 506.65 TaxID=1073090 RepID=A0A1L9SD19_9EURO|nr:hypothetical protein ASPZODRAFT_100149 [Penicilliopsis zonata CBS 506.65]OJJ45022.1 hypothetical protein ASPZODRAFT_100149 [Penicilliopsis zonata CBS 506.65]
MLPLLLLSLSSLVSADSWGGSVSLGPTTSDIIHAVTTIIPGEAPPTQNGELFLWPGMSNGTGDLIQTTLESWPSNAWCGATTGQWCVRASIFGSFGQLSGTGEPVSGDDLVRIEYTLLADDVTWIQNVTNARTGAYLSSYSYPAGPYMTGYGTGTECDDDCSGTVAAQTYINTTITLRSADPDFGDTIAVAEGGTYTDLASSEGGKVWSIATISIPAMTAASSAASAASAATSAAAAVGSSVPEASAAETPVPEASTSVPEAYSVPQASHMPEASTMPASAVETQPSSASPSKSKACKASYSSVAVNVDSATTVAVAVAAADSGSTTTPAAVAVAETSAVSVSVVTSVVTSTVVSTVEVTVTSQSPCGASDGSGASPSGYGHGHRLRRH